MKIACLSGKGGAGKTLTAVNLAAVAERAVYIDCDVEEPNGRLFFQPGQVTSSQVSTLLPVFDAERCTGCKKCVQFCRFHALMYIKEKPMVFSEVCHSCGGCSLPIIREALKLADGFTVLDCPPGSACSVMECVMDADFCVLVAEPTAFGFHNFQMVYELVSLLGKPCGVVINKQDAPYEPLEQFCREQGLPILARIPYDSHLAALAATGQIVSSHSLEMNHLFSELLEQIQQMGGVS